MTSNPALHLKFIVTLIFLAAVTACATSNPTATAIHTNPVEATFTVPDQTPAALANPTTPPVPPSTETSVEVSQLTRDQLRSAAYPNEWPTGGIAQLVDGQYREKYTPDSATEMIVSLSHLVVFGDLDDDGVEDAAAIIVVDPGGSGTFYYLAAVLNQNGSAKPVASYMLGDRTFIRSMNIKNGAILIELDHSGPEDPACCPTDSKAITLQLDGDQLVETEVVDLPDPEMTARFGDPPQRVAFDPGATTAVFDDRIIFNGINGYLVAASVGQTMTVALTSPHNDVWLSIRGYDGGTVLHSIQSETASWVGQVPSTQDYLVNAVAAGGATPYHVRIDVTGAGGPAASSAELVINTPINVRQGPGTNYDIVGGADPGERFAVTGRNQDGTWWQIAFEGHQGWVFGELVTASNADAVAVVAADASAAEPTPSKAIPTPPSATAKPEEAPASAPPPASEASRQVIYLTFDDGPTDPQWTPQVMEVLSRYGAKGTFFVLGQLAQAYPQTIQAQANAGHALANHTYDHSTLDSIGREAFFQQIQNTEQALSGVITKCLRPPYGATDAYTRAYAEELGYQIIMWDIDTRDWSRPGIDAIVSTAITQAFPGAVVLFHDGGGDRAQTVSALEQVLGALSGQGYVFDALCQ